MPDISKKQDRFMQAAAHNKEFANKANIHQSVAKEFVKSDSKNRYMDSSNKKGN